MTGTYSISGLLSAAIVSFMGPVAILTLLGFDREIKIALAFIFIAVVSFLVGKFLRSFRLLVLSLIISILATFGIGVGTKITIGEQWWIPTIMTSFPVLIIVGFVFLAVGKSLRKSENP